MVDHGLFKLAYGGASMGLMGALADSVLSRGGQVCGVMPEALIARDIAHEPGLRLGDARAPGLGPQAGAGRARRTARQRP
jgi:hypothetical protein